MQFLSIFLCVIFTVTRVVNEWGPQTLGVDPGSISANQAKEIIKQG